MSFKAILFDLDGTLLDTIDDLADAMSAALGELGYAARAVHECKFFVGDGRHNFALRALPQEARDQATVARCADLLTRNYAANWAAKTRPYDGIGRMLRGVAGRGLAMAVLSNKPDQFTRQMVEHFFPSGPFRIVRGAVDGEALKPDPSAALEIAEALELSPEAFLYLGDTDTDMKTATAARMFAVGAAWGFRPAEELLASGAKKIIDHPTDLLRLI